MLLDFIAKQLEKRTEERKQRIVKLRWQKAMLQKKLDEVKRQQANSQET